MYLISDIFGNSHNTLVLKDQSRWSRPSPEKKEEWLQYIHTNILPVA